MKKTRATQNFNMAAIFQDGRHGLSWKHIFAFERQKMVEKGNYDIKFYVISIENALTML